MRTCRTCLQDKDVSEFGLRAKSRDGINTQCRECKRQYQNANYETSAVRRSYLVAKHSEVFNRNRAHVYAYLLEHPCVDCGETDPIVLQFDHQRDKVAGVSVLIGYATTASLTAEIEKCEVRCANCHTRRTAAANGWYKHLRG